MATRKETMTNRQRVEALLNREKPDRVPIYPFGMGFSLTTMSRGLLEKRPHLFPKEEMGKITIFLNDISKRKGQRPLEGWPDKLADFFNNKFGPDWQENSVSSSGKTGKKINSFLTFHTNSN